MPRQFELINSEKNPIILPDFHQKNKGRKYNQRHLFHTFHEKYSHIKILSQLLLDLKPKQDPSFYQLVRWQRFLFFDFHLMEMMCLQTQGSISLFLLRVKKYSDEMHSLLSVREENHLWQHCKLPIQYQFEMKISEYNESHLLSLSVIDISKFLFLNEENQPTLSNRMNSLQPFFLLDWFHRIILLRVYQ